MDRYDDDYYVMTEEEEFQQLHMTDNCSPPDELVDFLISKRVPGGGGEEEEEEEVTEEEKQEDLLVESITLDFGYAGDKPVVAFLIYKCLIHWKSFELETTSVFNRIMQIIDSAIGFHPNNRVLALWLTNSATLLVLLQRTPQVEAKFPALIFKQQLTAFLQKMYRLIRDNLKEEISDNLKEEISYFYGLCKQRPRTSHWQHIRTRSLNHYLNEMKTFNVPPFLVRKLFTQIFSFINLKLFNSLLQRPECCSFSNGDYLKAGLAGLEQWCIEATYEYVGSAWDELKHIRQAVDFLVTHQEPKKSLDEISRELCPVLSKEQLERISTMYWDVSSDVIAKTTEDSNNAVSSSLLLDDDSSIPFTVEDISKSMPQVDVNDIEPPQNSGFGFLLSRKEGTAS